MTQPATRTHGDVAGVITRRCEQVIRDELVRLDHRQPSLDATQLAVIGQALTELADRLLLDAIRRNPSHLRTVEALFALDEEPEARTEGTP